MISPVQLPDTEVVKEVRPAPSYRVPFVLLASINLVILVSLVTAVTLEKLNTFFGRFINNSSSEHLRQHEIPSKISDETISLNNADSRSELSDLLKKIAKNSKSNVLVDLGNYKVAGEYIIVSSIYEKVLDTNDKQKLFTTYKIDEELYNSLGSEAREYLTNSSMSGSPETLDANLHSLNIYKIDTVVADKYDLIKTFKGVFKAAKFYDEGRKLLAVRRDYENNFYIYVYDLQNDKFEQLSQIQTGNPQEYYGVGIFSKDEKFVLLQVGYEFLIPTYIINLTTGYIDPILTRPDDGPYFSQHQYKWLDNGNLQYNEALCRACGSFDMEMEGESWLVEYNPTTRKVVSRVLLATDQ